MNKLGFSFDRELNLFSFKNNDIDLKIHISQNLFGYYKLNFDIAFGSERYNFNKWSYSQDISFNHYMFDCLNMYCCYGYLLNNGYKIEIKELLENTVYDISGKNDSKKIRFCAIDRLFKEGVRNKVEHYQNSNIIQITNHSLSDLFYLPTDYEFLKFVMEYKNTPAPIDYSIFEKYIDLDETHINDSEFIVELYRAKTNNDIKHYKFESSPRHYFKPFFIDFHIFENMNGKDVFIFRLREQKIVSLTDFNYKIIPELISLLRKHVYLKYELE